MLSLRPKTGRSYAALLAGALCSALVLLWALPRPAHADPLATIDGKTLELQAERLELDLEGRNAKLSGHVRARLGKLRIRAEQIEIEYDRAPSVKRVSARAGVTVLYDGARVEAKQLDVDVIAGEARLTGGVDVKRGQSKLRASSAVIDLRAKKLRLEQVTGSIELQRAPAPSSGQP